MSFIKQKFGKKKQEYGPANAPEDTVIYAIGDIHGRYDLLQDIHKKIELDVVSVDASRRLIVYMGDYIDRGLQSKQVIDCFVRDSMPGFDKIYLKGNHELAMMRFLQNSTQADTWMMWGGEATLRSYGVNPIGDNGRRKAIELVAEELAGNIPGSHIDFLNNLKISHVEGDYFFVHAGLRPGVPIEEQSETDMLMIRDEFILSRRRFDKTVVFGHTIFDEPVHSDGRIGIDTGAFASGILTAVVLEGKSVRFLHS